MNIGILGAASIARNRFLPALKKINSIRCAGIAARNPYDKRLIEISKMYDIKIYESYDAIINSKEIDAVYIPLPPALHFEWAKKALEAGKHVLSEKPATINLNQIKDLVSLAKEKRLALYENYMFVHHAQLSEIKRIIEEGVIGDVRLYRATFSFPRRERDDFRYNKSLGGGALLDAGGYVVKITSELLGDDFIISSSNLVTPESENVDIFGSFTAVNSSKQVLQGSFGMDNNYQCSLEVMGQKAKITTDRIFTAGADFEPVIKIFSNEPTKVINLPKDDHFKNSILFFNDLINSDELRESEYEKLINQATKISIIRRDK